MFDPRLAFGGVSVIVLGDFLQLPPVGGSSVYIANQQNESISTLLNFNPWSLFNVHKLTEIMRQRDDIPFSVALNNMAQGIMSANDIALFQSRVLMLSSDQLKLLDEGKIVLPEHQNLDHYQTAVTPINLFFSNKDVNQANHLILNQMTTEGAVSTAFDRVIGNCRNQTIINQMLYSANEDAPLSETRGLLKKLILKVEAKYMMTINIDTADGLVNGVIGVLKRIDYGRRRDAAVNVENSGSRKALRLWLLFDDEKCGRNLRSSQAPPLRHNVNVPRNWTCIEPHSTVIRRNIKSSIQLNRTQFPLVPAEAMTVHKSQGGTYKNVIVSDCGKKTMSRSMKYVACSPATSAQGLSLICRRNKFIPPKPLTTDKYASALRDELTAQESNKLVPIFEALTEAKAHTIRIISHNVQSLRAHIDQIRNDHVYLTADVILLAETWTLPNNEDYRLDRFSLLSRCDGQSSVPKPVDACCYVKNEFIGNRAFKVENKMFSQRNTNHSVCTSIVHIENEVFCSIYCSPNTSITVIMQALDFIVDRSYIFMTIAGDFNVDFDTDNGKKTSIMRFMAENNLRSTLQQSALKSTTTRSTFIDNIFTNRTVIKSGMYISFTSYHEPLYAEVLF